MSTAIDMMKMDKERQTRMFEAMIESFLRRWMPEDRRDAAEFDRDFHVLVRQIYRDAQEPLLDHITKFAAAMPMQFMIPNDAPKPK